MAQILRQKYAFVLDNRLRILYFSDKEWTVFAKEHKLFKHSLSNIWRKG